MAFGESYAISSRSRLATTFPFIRMYGGKAFHQSLLNADTVKDASERRAKEESRHLRASGWLVRIKKYETSYGDVYVLYERRSTTQKGKMAKDYGRGHVKAAGIVNEPPRSGRRARRRM